MTAPLWVMSAQPKDGDNTHAAVDAEEKEKPSERRLFKRSIYSAVCSSAGVIRAETASR